VIQKKRFKAKSDYKRIDHFLNESLPDISRSKIEKLIKDEKVTLNEQLLKRKNQEIIIGDMVEIELPSPDSESKQDYTPSFELKKLYEDEYLLIIDKPIGISVHPGAGVQEETLLDVFRYYYPEIDKIEDTDRPGIVHRLDKDTSGVMILAKDNVTMRRLQKRFKKRVVEKTYLAFASGKIRYLNGTVNAPIIRNPRYRTKYKVSTDEMDENARESITDYSVIKEFPGYTFVKLMPKTGRTHQLRVHLTYYGNPILGDRLYGNQRDACERLALHAFSIKFYHPHTEELISAYSPLPKSLRSFLKKR
jgi:23S rRNA pseudouridine1911/1915/1917 synthase